MMRDRMTEARAVIAPRRDLLDGETSSRSLLLAIDSPRFIGHVCPMRDRIVIPELLDHLPADDPDALRSRIDLRRINFFMGNERWLRCSVRRFQDAAIHGITELGAGTGDLTRMLAKEHPRATVTAMDLAPAPPELPPNVVWRQGDLFSSSIQPEGGILIANLFLHHFEGDALRALGKLTDRFQSFIFCEPLRARIPHLLGGLAHPFINRVTRHDMHVSIDAGFKTKELPSLMGLSEKRWVIEEHSTWRGALHVLGCRA